MFVRGASPLLNTPLGQSPFKGVEQKVLEAQLMRAGGWEKREPLKVGRGKKNFW